LDLSPLILRVDGRRNQRQSPSEEEPNYGDSSRKLYSMYCKIADDEDNKMVEYCQKEADGILIFVGPHITP
jgi:hypothetical protein